MYQYENSLDVRETLTKLLHKIDRKIRDINYLMDVDVDSPFGERMRGQRYILQEIKEDLLQILTCNPESKKE